MKAFFVLGVGVGVGVTVGLCLICSLYSIVALHHLLKRNIPTPFRVREVSVHVYAWFWSISACISTNNQRNILIGCCQNIQPMKNDALRVRVRAVCARA